MIPIATASPSFNDSMASERQWTPAILRANPMLDASLFGSPPTVRPSIANKNFIRVDGKRRKPQRHKEHKENINLYKPVTVRVIIKKFVLSFYPYKRLMIRLNQNVEVILGLLDKDGNTIG